MKKRPCHPSLLLPLGLLACSAPERERTDVPGSLTQALSGPESWVQWGRDPQHSGAVNVVGQDANRILANLVYDPFVPQELAETGGTLVVHYQVPLVEGKDVFMEYKTGTFTSCSPPGSGTPFPCGNANWDTQIWNQRRLHWEGGKLVEKWNFASDWKPPPRVAWEPVFHGALARGFVFVPGAGGTIFKLNKGNGGVIERINPFGSTIDPSIYVAGPISVDEQGNLLYNAIKLVIDPDPTLLNPWGSPVVDSWLVRVDKNGSVRKVTYASITPGTPSATDLCLGGFPNNVRPFPPSPDAVPPSFPCGAQRPGLNVAPAFGKDGTIYTVSRAHFNQNYGYLVAINPDLTPKWVTSMRGHLNNGCGVLLPMDGSFFGCRPGSRLGVDPRTNTNPAGAVTDLSSSSPVVTPDGSILYGAFSSYNFFRGNLFKFSSTGAFQASYDFGWDSTPAIYEHDGTYSIVIKDNHYFDTPGQTDGPYHIVQLSPSLSVEWRHTNTETRSCSRQPDGTLQCEETHPNGFEWCINAPAVDKEGNVYANSEDGNLYVLRQGGTIKKALFLQLALGAAYTPLSLDKDGVIYTQNAGRLFVAGR